MTEQVAEPSSRSKDFFPFAALAGVVMFILVAVVCLAFTKSNATYYESQVVTILQLNKQDMTGMSINELRTAKKTLTKAQRFADYPAATIARELQELDLVLAQKLEAVIR